MIPWLLAACAFEQWPCPGRFPAHEPDGPAGFSRGEEGQPGSTGLVPCHWMRAGDIQSSIHNFNIALFPGPMSVTMASTLILVFSLRVMMSNKMSRTVVAQNDVAAAPQKGNSPYHGGPRCHI
uniref:Putative transposase strongylocentrotus purpuratus: similar to transposase n=1 Tax=Ixodes ricinus TaxID=34613 RepID=A0A0K8RLH6_IXORI